MVRESPPALGAAGTVERPGQREVSVLKLGPRSQRRCNRLTAQEQEASKTTSEAAPIRARHHNTLANVDRSEGNPG